MLYLKSFTFNPFQQNTYILYTEDREAFLFDAGNSTASEHAMLSGFIREKNLVLKRFLLTHAHIDHIMGNKYVYDTYGLLPEVHRSELYFIDHMQQSAMLYGVSCEQSPAPQVYLDDNQVVTLGKYDFHCILAPGHSPGSICFYNKENDLLIAGDVLFYGSIGRTDLPMGDHGQLLSSISHRLLVLPDKTKVYPGHGESTTIGNERNFNPFLAGI